MGTFVFKLTERSTIREIPVLPRTVGWFLPVSPRLCTFEPCSLELEVEFALTLREGRREV